LPAQERLDVQSSPGSFVVHASGEAAYPAVLAVVLADGRVGRFAVHDTFFGLALAGSRLHFLHLRAFVSHYARAPPGELPLPLLLPRAPPTASEC
jgi:hypothetical protein